MLHFTSIIFSNTKSYKFILCVIIMIEKFRDMEKNFMIEFDCHKGNVKIIQKPEELNKKLKN